VRELYAVQLSGTHQTRNATAWGQIRTWAERHTGFDIPSDGGTTQQPVRDQFRHGQRSGGERASSPGGLAASGEPGGWWSLRRHPAARCLKSLVRAAVDYL
jgi:hypothetical protein